jgi:hypothetical protein
LGGGYKAGIIHVEEGVCGATVVVELVAAFNWKVVMADMCPIKFGLRGIRGGLI